MFAVICIGEEREIASLAKEIRDWRSELKNEFEKEVDKIRINLFDQGNPRTE